MKSKKIIGLFLIVITFCFSFVTVFSYVTTDWGYHSKHCGIDTSTLNDHYRPAANQAIQDWNSSGIQPNAFVFQDTSSNNKMYTVYCDCASGGMYDVLSKNENLSTNKTTRFRIRINSKFVVWSTHYNIKKSVFSHEIGHARALGDIPTGTNTLMGNMRDRLVIFAPTADDVAGVKSKY
ncbi:UNVERIFIED_CONTAM: hypothetical protein Cloal_2976 [Acetivibrio alkalicellulosi]